MEDDPEARAAAHDCPESRKAAAMDEIGVMEVPREFDCPDCGIHVFAFGGIAPWPPQPAHLTRERCAVCLSIRDIKEPDHREAIRAALLEPEEIQHWKAIGCYQDESYSERLCDHCGQPYRGPAVYCSLACAVADV